MGGAVSDAVGSAVRGAVSGAGPRILTTYGSEWFRYIGGQFWVGWWYWWGPASIAFAIDVLRLDIGREMELRARAYATVASSACWWWPHGEFCIVSERPHTLEKNENGRLKIVAWDGWKVERQA